jgi:tripartite-type tricarboxylate transporter receptor subunit TctC
MFGMRIYIDTTQAKAHAMNLTRRSSLVLLLACTGLAHGQAYPTGPVKILVGFAPGGVVDSVTRKIADRLGERLGTNVVVENRPGASGTIAGAAVARATPDGQTLLFGVAANMAVAPSLMRSPPYEPVKAFAPVAEVARGQYVWLVRTDSPVTNMKEFASWARSQPGKLNYASPGQGSVHHLATEMLVRALGVEMTHVPYRTSMYVPLLGGEVHAMLDSLPGPLPHLESGKLRAVAVTGPRRLARLPDVPTLGEQGVTGVDASSWWGVVAPAGTPAAVVQRLNTEINAILAEPAFRTLLASWGVEPSQGTPQAFGAYIQEENMRWKAVIGRVGVTLD